MASLTTDQIFVGIGLLFVLAAGSQVLASRLRVPALIVLLPVGFLAGAVTDMVDPTFVLGAAFQPAVSLAVAVILYEAGLGLDVRRLRGRHRWVVGRLVLLGVPITWGIATVAASALLDLSAPAALMLGAILVVSGPTVVGPLLAHVRPTERVERILGWEGSLIDPVGAILGALVFNAIVAGTSAGSDLGGFLLSMSTGVLGGLVGIAALWFVLVRLRIQGALRATAQLAIVIGVAGICDAMRDDAGLLAAILMGLVVGNAARFRNPVRRPSLESIVQVILGLLFVSISATVTPASLNGITLRSLALVVVLVLVARPIVTLVSTTRADLPANERAFIGWMAPRGIVAAATASTFGTGLTGQGIPGADRILPATFVVIVATVALYGLTARPASRWLGVTRPAAARPLIVGEHPWAVDLGRVLREAGVEVLVWASTTAQRRRSRAAGLPLADAAAVREAADRGRPLVGVNLLLLTGPDDTDAVMARALGDTVDGPVHRLRHDGAPLRTGPADAHRPRDGAVLVLVRADGSLVPVAGRSVPGDVGPDELVVYGGPPATRSEASARESQARGT